MRQDIKKLVHAFAADESGATAIEYGLIAAGIAGVIIATVASIGDTVKTSYYGKVQAAFDSIPK